MFHVRFIAVALLLSLLAIILVCGCDKDDSVRAYPVLKPAVASQVVEPVEQPAVGPTADSGLIQWKLPEGWKPLPPHEMRYAGFAISSADPQAMVTVSQAFGSLPLNINRWEKQVGLPPTPAEQIPAMVQMTQVGDDAAAIVDLKGKPKGEGGTGQRIRVAIARRGDAPWFFKLSGTSETVEAQSGNFDAFLASVHFADSSQDSQSPPPTAEGPSPSSPTPSPSPAAEGPHELDYQVPKGWAEQPIQPGGMRLASFNAGSGETQADVSVIRLPKNSGTLLDNVNRWRGQVGLDAVDDVAKSNPEQRNIGGQDATVFDFAGAVGKPGAKILAAIVPRGESWWFIKMTGPASAVDANKAAFGEFLASVRFRGN